MKFFLTLEAVDKASAAIKGVAKAQKGLNDQNIASANKAAKAYDNAAKATKNYNTTASKTEKQITARTKGWRGEANAVERLNKVMERQNRIANARRSRGVRMMGQGLGNIGRGAVGVAQYGAFLGTAAIGVGAGAVGLAMSGAKQAREYQQLQSQMQGVTKSAEAAKQAMKWIEAAQMPPHGLSDLTKSYIALQEKGINPTNGTLQALADAATNTNKPIQSVTNAYTAALNGNLGGLKQFGIEAKKNGKYIQYMFAGKDGKQQFYRAKAGDKGANAAAMQKALAARHGGAGADYLKTWDGMLWKIQSTWDSVTLKIMNAGVFDFMTQKLNRLVTLIDEWAADGSLERWCKQISDGLIATIKVGWEVAQGFINIGTKVYNALDAISGFIGGWKNMGMVLVSLPIMPSLLLMVLGFVKVGKGIGSLVKDGKKLFTFMKSLKSLSKIGSVLRLLLTPLGLVTRALWAMGVAFMSTPLGWVVAAIAAIAGGAYLIYRNWDKIGPYFKKIWEKTKEIFSQFWSWVKSLFTWDNVLTAINWLSYLVPLRWLEFIPGFPGWDTVISWFSWDTVLKALEWVKYIFQWTWDNVLTQIDWGFWLNPFRWVEMIPDFPGWGEILQSDTVQGFIDGIVGIFEGAKTKIKGVFDTIGGAWKFVKGLFSGGEEAAAVNIVAQDPQAIAAAAAEVENLTKKLEVLSGMEFGGTNTALKGLQDKTAETIAKAGGVTKAFEMSVNSARTILERTSFESHGVALMKTFAQGIRNGAGAAIEATRGVVQQIRDYLPHSPAKVGPLSDLDRVRFSETLATAMRPGPAVKAAARVAEGVRNVLNAPLSSGVSTPQSKGLSTGHNQSGPGSFNVSFAPQITIQGNADKNEVKQAIAEALSQLKSELPKLIDQNGAHKARLAY